MPFSLRGVAVDCVGGCGDTSFLFGKLSSEGRSKRPSITEGGGRIAPNWRSASEASLRTLHHETWGAVTGGVRLSPARSAKGVSNCVSTRERGVPSCLNLTLDGD